jgi:two-component system, chemotaxis family, sensor kinase CheA
MAIDLDDEILQDFVVEAGEILELLSEQLVELEQSPDDLELLNAIFRGFHTVKGGAGFLAVDPLVQICHQAEDVFNLLRQGDRQVTTDLMDVFLQVLDVVNEMFVQIRSGHDPDEADSELLEALKAFNRPTTEATVETTKDVAEPDAVDQEFESLMSKAAEDVLEADGLQQAVDDEITEKEFDDLLNVLDEVGELSVFKGNGEQAIADNATPADEISEEEFESLLDELHGKGKFITSVVDPKSRGEAATKNVAGSADEITEEEFEELLDELHGKGSFSASSTKKIQVQNIAEDKSSAKAADEITEDEFDELLDKLHGQGKFGAVNPQNKQETASQSSKPIKQDQSSSVAASPDRQPEQSSAPEKRPKVGAGRTGMEKTNKKASKPASPQRETTVRVDTQILDDIMNMVGELVLVRNRFQTLRTAAENEQFSKAVANLDVVTADLQLAVMKTRMQPIKKVFGRFPRVVRDLARNLKKEIRLDLRGEETDLDKNLVEALADPLVHLVRNAVDHGIETPEAREAAGKSREGVVVLTASQEGDHIELTIQDDGKGMNPDMLRQKAVEKGLMDQESANRLDDKECFNLIFAPGFSTKAEISDISGRGVGMDVVKTRISQMNGTVDIDSREGEGSIITIKVPLTLAIMPTLMVKLDGQAFALPLASVLEILDLDLGKTNVVDGQMCVVVRDKALPLFHLKDWLVDEASGYSTNNKDKRGHVVVVSAGGKHVGFVVDQLVGQEEVVIKPLGAKLQGLDGLAGATITGDGKIALILDVPGLIKKYVA